MRTKIPDTALLSCPSTTRIAMAICAVAVLAAGSELWPSGWGGAALSGESGILEIGSLAVLAVAGALGAMGAVRRPTWVRWSGAIVLLALLLRELDFQKRFTYRSIESLGFYTRPIASLQEKVLAAVILGICAAAAWALARAAWREWRLRSGRMALWARPALVGGVFLAIGLVSEKVLRLTVAEEVFELAFAACVAAVAWRMRPGDSGETDVEPRLVDVDDSAWHADEATAAESPDERRAA